MAARFLWRHGITLVLAAALLATAVAAVSAAQGRAYGAAQLSRRILQQSSTQSTMTVNGNAQRPATTKPLPNEALPQGFATAKLPTETVSISLLLKNTTKQQFKSAAMQERLLAVTGNVSGIPADQWNTTVANDPAPAVEPQPKQQPMEVPKANTTVPAKPSKAAEAPVVTPKPAETKPRSTQKETAVVPSIPKATDEKPAAEKAMKPAAASSESSKPEAKPASAAAAAAPATTTVSTTDVIIAGAQCGGRGGECGSKPGYKCADAAFAGYSCAAGYACKRQDEWYWHCDTDSSSAAAKSADPFTIGAYEQCGGQGGGCTGKTCADAVFPGYKCTLGYSCARQNEWYWQCVEEVASAASGGSRKLLLQMQHASRSLQQQQQQVAPGDLEVNLSILTDNPQLVIYRLSKAADAADKSGCNTQYCSELAAAGVPIDDKGIQLTPTLAAVTAQVAQASSTPRFTAISPADSNLQVQQPQQQQAGNNNAKLIGGIIGGVVGGILLLLLLVLGGKRLMNRRQQHVVTAEKGTKDVHLDQAPVTPPVYQSREFFSEGPTEAVAEVVKDPAVLQIRTSFTGFDTAPSAATIDQDPTPGPRFLAAAAAADAAAAGSSAAAAAAGSPDAAQPPSARSSFSLVPKMARSFSFTSLIPGRKSTSAASAAAAAADADVLVEPQTPEVDGARTERSGSAENSPLAFPTAPEDDEHHDDFDPHHSARNSFAASRRNSFANRRSFGDSLYRSGSRNSGEYSAYRRGINSYNNWASGAVPTAADLAAAVQKNVNSRRSFQKPRGPQAASSTPPGSTRSRRALHHSHSASDLTTRYTSAAAAAATTAAGAASPSSVAAAPAGAEDMPLSSFPISGMASGTTTPGSVAPAAFPATSSQAGVGFSSHAISGLTSGSATPSSGLVRPGDLVISRSDAILTSHSLAGLRSTANTPAPSVAGSLARGSTGSQGFPLNSYALSGLGSGYNTPGGSVAGPLSRVSYNSVAGIGPRGYPISALPSGCATPSSLYAGAVGSMTAGSHSHTLAPSVVAHALAGLESGYNTPAVSVAGSLARMSAGSEVYGGYNLNSHAIAGLASGAVTPSDRASVYSTALTGMPPAAALAAADDSIAAGIPIDSHALSGLASGCTTPGAVLNAAAEAAARGSGDGMLLFNAHALSNVQSGVSTPTSRRSLSTLSVHSDAEYAQYRRGMNSYTQWLRESCAGEDTAADATAQPERAPAAVAPTAETPVAASVTAPPADENSRENAATQQQVPSGPTGYALSIASGYSSPKSAAPVRTGPMFMSHALSDMGSGTMTPYSMSAYSAYASQAFDGASLREQRQMVDPAQLNQALSRYYSSVEGVVVSQPVSRRNSTSSVVPEMPRLAE